jgi:hypothetical protein
LGRNYGGGVTPAPYFIGVFMPSVVAELWKKDGTKTIHRFPTQQEYDAYPQYAIVREGVPCPFGKPQEVEIVDKSIQVDRVKRKYTRRSDANLGTD